MATALQPRLATPIRPRSSAGAGPAERRRAGSTVAVRESKLQRAEALDELSTRWRLALDAADTALRRAPAVLPPEPLRGRASLLKAERTTTAHLLEGLAQDFHVEAWLSDLEIPDWNLYRLLGLPETVKACVFDLEDVLAASPPLQVAAWGETWAALSSGRSARKAAHFAPFDPRLDYYAHLHARPRLAGVKDFLASRGIKLPDGDPGDPPGCETVHGLANLKQLSLLRRLETGHLNALTGSRRYLRLARRAGLRCAAISASANTQTILERTGLADLVATTVDGTAMVTQQLRRQPAPDVLLAACWQLDVNPELAAAFVSTVEGVEAGRSAGLALVAAIGEPRLQPGLSAHGADIVASSLSELLDRRLAAAR